MAYDNLTTVSSLKAWLRVEGNADDAELGALIQVASDLIGRYCGRDNLGKVYSYTENYFGVGGGGNSMRNFNIMLRHYPVEQLQSVVMNATPLSILSSADLQNQNGGVYLMEDVEPRQLRFQWLLRTSPITVTYTAGYAFNQIPSSLSQACNQYAAEIFKSQAWIGKKSVAISGETTTFDLGESWGISKRIMALLQPYRNVVPFMGTN